MNTIKGITVSVWFTMLVAIVSLLIGFQGGRASLFIAITRITRERNIAESSAALLQDIADMREQLFQQDERKLDAVRWCVTSSPTPIGCVSWSLENTR